ncbi:TetR/AcrR family transcriptional regulator [Pedobacter antarcticus]|uniref:TetR/AcrR family transcriptional regulator n=1 Tax=Pedobacter antarcticus TaxID=34086 RepID=UPI00292D3501|nr:TetR/AcrR family transcriptional regulator [Pedobacter antarcticus]
MGLSQDDLLRSQILQTAQQLYQRHGIRKVTMDDLAKAVGKTRSALYYYFKNRDELLEAVLLSLVQDVKTELENIMSLKNDLESKIASFCTAKIRGSEKSKNFISSIESGMDSDERSKYSDIMWNVHQKMMQAETILLKKVIQQAVDKKEIPAQNGKDLEALLFVLLSGIRGIRREITIDIYAEQSEKGAAILANLVTKELKR